MGITIMSATDYTTIARTPLNQLHTLPLEALNAYLAYCNGITQRAIQRVISASQGA